MDREDNNEDERRTYVTTLLSCMWGRGAAIRSGDSQSEEALHTFLDDVQCPVLLAKLEADGDKGGEAIVLSTQLQSPASSPESPPPASEAVFVKVNTQPLTPENISRNVQVTSMTTQSPLLSLYQSLHNVYAPLLLRNDATAGRLSQKLKDVLLELDAGLGSSVLLSGAASKVDESSPAALMGIASITDEFKYWESDTHRDTSRARKFSDAFDNIQQRYSQLESLSMDEMSELLDETKEALDDIWRKHVGGRSAPFPQARMDHVLGLVGAAINTFIVAQTKHLDLWTGTFNDVKAQLEQSTELCEKWIDTIKTLTVEDWPCLEEHRWEGPKSTQDGTLKCLAARVDEVLRLRSTYEELASLLPRGVVHEAAGSIFAPFHGLKALYYNPYSDKQWKAAVATFEGSLVPLEAQVGAILRDEISAAVGAGKVNATVRLLQRYCNLLRRPSLAKTLASERDTLLTQLQAHVEQMQGDFDTRSVSTTSASLLSKALHVGKMLSPNVNVIVWSHMLHTRVGEVARLAGLVLSDLPGYKALLTKTERLEGAVYDLLQDKVVDWQSEIKAQLKKDNGTALRISGKLMYFDEGTLVVNFSEFLVTLLRDVRQLSEIAAQHKPRKVDKDQLAWVPEDVRKLAADAEKYYRFGVTLKKVANFYNTVDAQILAEQRPMLLKSLLRFDELVHSTDSGGKSGKAVSWTNLEACNDYVQQLQSEADKVAGEIRRLKQAHDKLSDECVALMDVDLLRSQDKWRGRWEEVKKFVSGVSKKYESKNAQWLLFWDHQMYKVLESGYQLGLEMLHENLPEVKVITADLVFPKGGGGSSPSTDTLTLLLEPPVEELRAKYYKAIKKFITRPHRFQGFGNKKIFAAMCDANAPNLVAVYATCEQLFARVELLRYEYEPWSVATRLPSSASSDDTGGLLDCSGGLLSSPADWELNLKTAKAKKKEVEKLPELVKVDCVHVSLTKFKETLRSCLQKFHAALVESLFLSTRTHVETVDAFVTMALEKLNKPPLTIEEISTTQQNWKEIDAQRSAMQSHLDLAGKKRALLMVTQATATGSSIVAPLRLSELEQKLAALPQRWEDLEVALETFNDMIEDARTRLKGELETQVGDCNTEIDNFRERWHTLRPVEHSAWTDEALADVYAALADWREKLAALQDTSAKLTVNCATFAMPTPSFDGLEALALDVAAVDQHWGVYREFRTELATLADKDWISFSANMFVLQDCAQKWLDAVKALAVASVVDVVVDKLQDFVASVKRAMPSLKLCRGEPFKEAHWDELLPRLGMPRDVKVATLKLVHFVDRLAVLETPQTLQFLKGLHARAQGEVTIREALKELRGWVGTAKLSMFEHVHNDRTVWIIKDWKEILLELGDNQSLLASLKDSQFFAAFEHEAKQYEAKMALVDAALSQLNTIQRKWVFLEPIFSKGALPSEQGRFQMVDASFVDVMATLRKKEDEQEQEQEPLLFTLADEHKFPKLLEELAKMVDHLERCQKALADFLEEKRARMPRFYFIGDEDLLEILGQSQNAGVIQSHLKKLYQGVHRVEFSDDKTKIVAMCSAMGERVALHTPVAVTAQVEEWLERFTDEMRRTLRVLVAQCVAGKAQQADYYTRYPSQVLCLAEQIRFCQQAERSIQDGTVSELKASLVETLRELTSLDLTSEPLMSLKVKALVLDLVHHIDVCDQLVATRAVKDWSWQKQLRFYLDDKAQGSVAIHMNDAVFDYTYEYQGNAAKLVHTPLTDKCYLTLTQGMHMGFGGNPYGPAGTGKTESVKALGGQFGRQVLVFNCDEGIDFQAMGRIFIGLVKCGAWGCFDEFNRLKEDQLSAISQQIQVIQDAIKAQTKHISLLNRHVDVDFNAGIFVTLNPAGKGYGGRSKLPDNLKALFRPVAMGRPDNNLIAEVILYSEGFREAKDMASKVVSLYTLSGQLLSPQQHYDWGLRALKAVLNTAGKLLQAAKKERGNDLSAASETEILINAVRINTLSKLTFVDASRFLALIGDVFPGITSADLSGGKLADAIREVMVARPFFLEVDERQVRKMLQLHESLEQRMGCVLVGPSGSGKSTLWQVLQAALVKCGQPVATHVMNPKSMPRERLLGHMDLDTREFSDGVLTAAARAVVKEPESVKAWIICDGDVDPEWIESLNSVLDDNHLLTLPNGERISFGGNVNFLFETHDLRFASPATISRMGMIFLSDEDVEVQRLVTKWLLTQQPEARRISLKQWIDELFAKALDEFRKFELAVDTTLVGSILNGLSHVASATTRSEFVVALVRGLGANLSVAHRTAFAKTLFLMTSERVPDMTAPLDCYCVGSVFHTYETKRDTYGAMDGALDRRDLHGQGAAAVVPTVSVQRGLAMVAPWVANMEPFILVGPEGCGKNMLIKQAFRDCKNVSVTVLHCNAQTTADHVIHKIAQCCALFATPNGRVYRPRDAERLVLYLKDINLPKPDMYDTCMLIAFLQQLLTFQGFYDANREFLGIDKIQIVASMNAATTVGRHPLSTRFTAIVRVAAMDYPTSDELHVVYATFLEAVLNDASVDAAWRGRREQSDRLARAMVDIYDATRTKFTVDDHRHYLFTPRDLTQWVSALARYDLAADSVLDVVCYEATRLFRDRLVDEDARGKFDGVLARVLKQQFRHAVQELRFSSLHSRASSSNAAAADSGGEAVAAPLVRVGSDDFGQVVQQGLTLYEREEKELHLLLFDEILDHVAVVERVLSAPGGSLLLVGHAGVGRRSATTLVAYLLGYTLFSPSATRQYDAAAFKTDLKSLVVKAGVEGVHTVLYLEDHHLAHDAGILEITNSLLSAGEVPGLFSHEELEPLISPLKEKMLDAMGSGSTAIKTVYDFFVSRVAQFVHVVLAMDARHTQFLVRCESNPALYTRCAIAWLGEWSTASMRTLPALLLQGSSLADTLPRTLPLLQPVYEICQRRVRGGATPREFVSFLHTWRSQFEAKAKQVAQDIEHLTSGLSKLEEAAKTVDDLSRSARVKKAELGEAQTAASAAMKGIEEALDSAASRRNNVEQLKKQLAEAEKSTTQRKREIETELSEITPVLQSAKEAVGNIKSDNLNEIRSLKMPPEPIHDVLSAVLMLLGIQDTSWNSMKKFLGNRGVKDDILNYDAHRITGEISKAVSKLVKTKAASFDHETITRVSVAAAPLATWVKANLKYALVLNKIEPLENDLAEAKRALDSGQQKLRQYEEDLAKIDTKVAHMKAQLNEKMAEAAKLSIALETAEATLTKAQGLLSQLGGEQTRWSAQVKELEARQKDLPVRMLLAAAFTTFLGKCSEDVRAAVLHEWEKAVELPVASSFEYRKLMSTESELLTWKAMGLPADTLSMENALVVVHSWAARCPFIIDPASACTAWLKAELDKDTTRPLTLLQAQDARFVATVEQAVRFGRTLVVLEVDTVEPYLYPLVRKDLIHQGPRYVVALGDKVVDYNENFRLLLVTRNPSPPLAPDALAIVNVVNFTVTKSGLEGQLLGVTLQHEQPALEQEKSELLKQEEDCKVQLAALETQLVKALASSEGDILDNALLIESLTRTKATSAEIEQALARSATKSQELDEKRDTYRPFAHEGATLFFLVKQLSAVNHMYRFSLASFVALFKATLATKMDAAAASTKDRIHRLLPVLEHKVLMAVGRALFKEHRPMFGMHLVHGMHRECFDSHEYAVFCGDAVADKAAASGGSSTMPLPEWASPERKEAFARLCETLPRLAQQCKFDSTDLWLRWSRSPECEQSFHAKTDKALSPFQKLLVVQALRPDRLQSAIVQFICGVMALKSLTPPPLDFHAIATDEASHVTPVLLLTTAGADPSKELEEVAHAAVGRDLYFEVAMGGGQQDKALSLLRATAERGGWLCLQNLHLVVAWLPVLEKELNVLQANAKFRLWLTTEPHDAFPLVLLEQSIKITFESPPGLKKNLQRTYAAWSPAFIAQGGSLARAQLLFLLAFFHALLQERRTFIPQGWTKFYEFSFGDFRAGTNVIELGCRTAEKGGAIDWATLHGLMENAIYGGRVDNPYDLRVLRCNLAEYFSGDLLSGHRSVMRGVKMPQSTRHEDFMELIDRLPDSDAPAVFGLPDNIERSMQRTLSGAVIAQLKMLSASEEEGGKFDREQWRAQLGPLLESWAKWTATLSLESGGGSAGRKNLATMAPADAFVVLENEYALELTLHVHQGLQGLKKVIYGTGLLTPAIQTIGAALLKGAVPMEWSAKWDASENAQVWLRALALRKRALLEWQEASSSGKLLARGLDLSDLLHPGTFLNALRQQSARQLKCSMDGMQLLSCWEKDKIKGSSLEWFEITNLLLQGASFEGGNLVEAHAEAQELVAVPPCYVAYARDDEDEIYAKESCIKVPLYYATSRERLLVEIAMPINGDHARWILAGVALFLGE